MTPQLLGMQTPESRSTRRHERPAYTRPASARLTFDPLAWLKLQFLLHAGDTEVGAFGISAEHNLLHIEDIVAVRQTATTATVAFDDQAVADHFDDAFDAGLPPARCGRIWIHTHPGDSAHPSLIDEDTFARVFGSCDWSVMFILSRTGNTYARLRSAGSSTKPPVEVELDVRIDWARWPGCLSQELDALAEDWQDEYGANVHAQHEAWGTHPMFEGLHAASFDGSQDPFDRFESMSLGASPLLAGPELPMGSHSLAGDHPGNPGDPGPGAGLYFRGRGRGAGVMDGA